MQQPTTALHPLPRPPRAAAAAVVGVTTTNTHNPNTYRTSTTSSWRRSGRNTPAIWIMIHTRTSWSGSCCVVRFSWVCPTWASAGAASCSTSSSAANSSSMSSVRCRTPCHTSTMTTTTAIGTPSGCCPTLPWPSGTATLSRTHNNQCCASTATTTRVSASWRPTSARWPTATTCSSRHSTTRKDTARRRVGSSSVCSSTPNECLTSTPATVGCTRPSCWPARTSEGDDCSVPRP
mmetsp:Transcript_1246/g.3219  ORF Transcript_1246/g.3219 Transcript_1246/m.3219 type:complete len:235 (+) Transcript_1246:403-1107(+)